MLDRVCFGVFAGLVACGSAAGQLSPLWSIDTGRVTPSTARLVDVTGDGLAEVLIASMGPVGAAYSEGQVGVYDLRGQPLPGWPVTVPGPMPATVAVGDVTGDGRAEVVAQGWQFLYVWNADGTEVSGWPFATGASSSTSPVLADVTGDGVLEIVSSMGTALRVLRGDGSIVWEWSAPEAFQTPAVGDVTGDGRLEVVAGTWRPNFPDPVSYALYMFGADGAVKPGFPITGLGSVRGPVSIADLDGDGAVELVVRAADRIHVVGADGSPRAGFPITVPGPVRNATPALGDLTGDGNLEIVIGGFHLYAYRNDGSAVPGWPVMLPNNSANIRTSAAIADIDGDPSTIQVLVKIRNEVVAFHGDGSPVAGFPHPISDGGQSITFEPAVTIGDAYGDGKVSMVFASTSGRIEFVRLESGLERAPWPTHMHNSRNTSFSGGEVVCYPDCDGDGQLDFFDFLCFQNAFLAQDPYADCDGDGVLDFFDFLCFQNEFLAGCP